MVDSQANFDAVTEIESRVKRDIQSRGLVPGDRYMTADQVAKRLGVSEATANRAMQRLAQQSFLTRQKRLGTFVGPKSVLEKSVTVRSVYVFVPTSIKNATPLPFDAMIEPIRKGVGDVNVQFCFVPEENGLAYIAELVRPAIDAGHLAGMVAVSCESAVYRYLSGLKIPFVIAGSWYVEDDPTPCVDADNRQSGRSLAKYLVERKHARIAVIHDGGQDRPGDHDFVEGVAEALSAVKLAPNALLVRSYTGDVSSFRAQLRHMIESRNRPTAFICRGLHVADLTRELVEKFGLRVPKDVEITCEDFTSSRMANCDYVHVCPALSISEIADVLGQVLAKLQKGEQPADRRVVIPVQLAQPRKKS